MSTIRNNISLGPTIDWQNVPDFPGYRVDVQGGVWSCWGRGFTSHLMTSKWKLLKPRIYKKTGYYRVTFSKCGKRYYRFVHRIVLESFVGPCPNEQEGCHEDGDPSHNWLKNLRWDTPRNNAEDKRRHGTLGIGSKHPRAKIDEITIIRILEMAQLGISQSEIGKKYGITASTVSSIERGRIWRHVTSKSATLICRTTPARAPSVST